MKKFTLLFITFFSVILLTSCINIDLGGTKTPTPTVDTTPTPFTEYTVTFMNGDKVHKTYTIQEGSKVNKPANPTKEGYNFLGWSTNENVKNDFDFDKPITSNITVYACFERIVEKDPTPEITTYSVIFINGNKIHLSSTVEKGKTVTKPINPTKEGYTFICWSLNSTSKQEYDFNSIIRDNLTLYAYFEVIEDEPTNGNDETPEVITYTVTFMNGNIVYNTASVNEGNKVTKPTNPTKEGYNFVCWSTSSTTKQEFNFDSTIIGNLTLYAYFEVIEDEPTNGNDETPEVITYTVTFMNGSTVYNTANIIEGNKVTKPVKPTKEGYNFVCWSTNSTTKQEFNFDSTITGNLTLYAYFEEIVFVPTTYSVTFMNGNSVYYSTNIVDGNKVTKPNDPVAVGYNFICWSTSIDNKNEFNFNTTITNDLILYAYFEEIPADTPVVDLITVTAFSGYNEGAYIEFDSEGYNSSDFSITYTKENSSTKYTVDAELIRKNGSIIRCDILGLVKGTYYITVTNTKNNKAIKKAVGVTNHDRSGYAHFDNTVGVGAYNDDGSLKTNAIVIYVNESNKNTVTAKFGSKTYTGLGAILTAAKDSSYPLCVRILGSVKTAQWNSMSHGTGKTQDRTNNLNNTFKNVTFSSGKLSYSSIVSAGINSMSNDINNGITILNGLTTNVLYSSGEYDSYYNMLDINNASNITVEGVGVDATIYQWGLNFKQCNNIEVRNLTFDRYTEDALGFEGTKSDISKYGNYWIHNCTFNIGVNNWDVSYEADKYDGDGSTDIKYCRGVTVSYTTYNNTHKTMLIGGNDEAKQYNITIHHNYFNNCNSRLPLVRQANVHIYNNYFYKTSGVCSSVRANSSAFIENNYYDQAKNPIMLVKKDSYQGTSVKSFGNLFNNCTTSSNSSTDTYYRQNTVSSRTATISGSCNPTGSKELINFDTNSSLFYYDSTNQVSKVENLLEASLVKDYCIKYSGVLKANFISDVQPEQPKPETPSIPDDDNENNNNPSNPGDNENLSTTYITFNNFPLGNITDSSYLSNITIVGNGKTATITATEQTLNGQIITSFVKFSGGGSYTMGCINFDTQEKANITVYYENTGSNTRYAALFDNSNTKFTATTEATSTAGIVNYTFTNIAAGSYSVASAGSGLNIYLIVIEYI